MKPLNRLFVFLFFVLSFFILTIGVVFYTLGYRFSFDRGIFVYTGSISIKANPSIVNISVDGKSENIRIGKINNSYHISSLQPGEHFLEITAPGYEKWSKKVTVHSGLSTEFWNVILPKKDYEITRYSLNSTDKLFPSPESNLLSYVTKNEKGFAIGTFDTTTDSTTSFSQIDDASFDIDSHENIEWSIDSNYLSIPAKRNDKQTYFIINVDNQETQNLNEITTMEDLRLVRWDSSRRNILFTISGNTLYEINLNSPTEPRTIAENIQSYDISGNDLYFLELPNAIVYRTSITNPEAKVQITTKPVDISTDKNYSVIAYDESRIVLINYITGKLFMFNKDEENNTHFSELLSDAKGAQFSDDGKKLLYWNDWEMFTYFTRDWETQPVRITDSILNIGRFSQSISNVHWTSDYEHITFSVGNTIKIIELDNRGERSLMDVTELQSKPNQVINNFADDILFYSMTDTSIENAQRNQLHSIDFPEKTSLFNFNTRQ